MHAYLHTYIPTCTEAFFVLNLCQPVPSVFNVCRQSFCKHLDSSQGLRSWQHQRQSFAMFPSNMLETHSFAKRNEDSNSGTTKITSDVLCKLLSLRTKLGLTCHYSAVASTCSRVNVINHLCVVLVWIRGCSFLHWELPIRCHLSMMHSRGHVGQLACRGDSTHLGPGSSDCGRRSRRAAESSLGFGCVCSEWHIFPETNVPSPAFWGESKGMSFDPSSHTSQKTNLPSCFCLGDCVFRFLFFLETFGISPLFM